MIYVSPSYIGTVASIPFNRPRTPSLLATFSSSLISTYYLAIQDITYILTMAPSRIDDPLPSFSQASISEQRYSGPPRNIANIDAITFDKSLQPKNYEIRGTHPESRILFTDVQILDSTGRDPYAGDVLIEGERITRVGVVPGVEELKKDPKVRVFHGRGRTLMSGLGDAHTHFTWNGGDMNRLGELGVEEHVLLTARSAQCYIDSGYTMYAPLVLFISGWEVS